MKHKVHIIGVGPVGSDSLSPQAKATIEQAEILIGGQRIIEMFPKAPAEKIVLRRNIADVIETIKQHADQKRIVVLSSGDPGFFGITNRLIADMGKELFEVVPNVSSMQLAFARIKESWDDAVFVSAHGRRLDNIISTVRGNHKIGIFTDERNTPATIAEILIEHGIDGYRAYVCEDLGLESERIVATDLSGLREIEFSKLNLLILIKETSGEFTTRGFGVPDEQFHHRGTLKGQITKQEIRAISLAKLQLSDHSIVWDIGAGSGSVSVEAAFLAKKGEVFAIERNAEDTTFIKQNIEKFGAINVEIVCAEAPDGLQNLPDPDAVFIGGSGGNVSEILDMVAKRLKSGGRVVVNLVTLENLNEVSQILNEKGFQVETVLANISRSTEIAYLTRLEPLSPIFILTGVKDGK